MSFTADDGRHHTWSRAVSWLSAFIFLASFCFLYWGGMVSLLRAWSRAEYSHGYLIAPIAVLLFLHKNNDPSHLKCDPGNYSIGLPIAAMGAAIGLFGNLASIPDITTYGMLVCILGLILSVLGSKRGIRMWPAWLYLFFMLPLPNFIYWPLSIKLQFLSSEIGVRIIQFFDIPVYLDGNIIDLGVYKLQVAEACSGLRYLFPLMSFGYLFALLYVGNWWQKLVLFLSTLPITIGMNSLRIAIIGVLVNGYGIAQAEGFLHFFEGWIVFVVCVLLLYLEAKLLHALTAQRQESSLLFDFDLHGLIANVRHWQFQDTARKLLMPGIIVLAASLLWFGLERGPISPAARQPLAQFPLTSAVWTGKPTYLSRDVEKVLAADDYLVADFQTPTELSPVNFLVSYYASQTKGSGVHSPEVCLPAGGWEVSRWGQAAVTLRGQRQETLTVNRAIIQKGQDRQLVYYWFEQRGRHLSSDYLAKFYTVVDSVTRGRSDGALVRVVTPIDKLGIEKADERLRKFLEFAFDELPAFVPS